MRKGQTALEYLMTYGWAILIIVIVGAALFALGIFNPSSFTGERCTGFSQLQVKDWQLNTTGHLRMKIGNQVGANINITSVSYTVGTNTGTNLTQGSLSLASGADGDITVSGIGTQNADNSYSASVTLTYTNVDTGFTGHKSSGTCTGKVV